MHKLATAARTAIAITALVGLSHATLAQDVENGQDIFNAKCKACHRVGPGATNTVGPVLNKVFGRKAGTAEAFAYSDAMKAAGGKGLTWTDETIDKYLADPRGFVEGNKMAFVGLRDPADRKDIIAYLKKYAK